MTLKQFCYITIFTILSFSNCAIISWFNPPQIAEIGPSISFTPEIQFQYIGTDNTAIAGWYISSSDQKPDLNDTGWKMSGHTYTFTSFGTKQFYAWAKDDENNISDMKTFSVTYKQFSGNWTIMVWMDGDNNLEDNALDDFEEMEQGLANIESLNTGLEEKLAVVVQFDRISGFSNDSYDDGDDWTGTRRYLIKPDINELSIGSQKLQELGEINMGDANSLKNFIIYCKTTFPAEHYALVLWNHGGGIRSLINNQTSSSRLICIDDSSLDDGLYTGEITDVLSDAESINVLGADACLMGTAEIAYEYRPGVPGKFSADYYVASPALEQGDGWDYTRIFNRLKGSGIDAEGDICYNISTITPEQLANVIVKEYKDFTVANTTEETMTAFDLSEIEDVKTELDLLAALLADQKSQAEAARGTLYSANSLHYFDDSNLYDWLDAPHFDLYDVAERIYNDNSTFTIETCNAALNLLGSIDSCVITSYAGIGYINQTYNGNLIDGKHGLAWFFPDGDTLYYEYKEYAYQYWYTDADTTILYGVGFEYGKIDFCNSDSDGIVETWRELLEFWYDNPDTYTPDSW